MDDESGEEMQLDSEGGIVEVYSDITTNQIWTSNNIYYIGNSIQVQALLVIEPGTTLWLDNECGLFVNNGGTLISAGTPDNPIIYTSVYEEPDWADFYCAIYVEKTASPATKITYNQVEFAEAAITTDNIKLNTPIQIIMSVTI